MAIKTEVNIEAKGQNSFPKLMQSTIGGAIVLFYKEEKGNLLHRGNHSEEVGYYSTDWSMNHFEDYNEKLTLTNE
jgi:hypothetical protein